MAKSISNAVEELLSAMPLPYGSFKHNILNLSALARLIKSSVEEKIGEEAGLDAIVAAIKRYGEGLEEAPRPELLEVIAGCTLTLRAELVSLCIKDWLTKEIQEAFHELEGIVDWHAEEKLYIIQRSGELTLITNPKLAPMIEVAVKPPAQMISKTNGLAVLTVEFPPTGPETPGLFAFFTQKLAEVGVNIHTVFSTHMKVSLIIPVGDAHRAYEAIHRTIAAAKSVLNSVEAGA